MATPPDFTTGQVLTGAQMNAVGLWLLKTQTIGTAVAQTDVSNAFSADYEAYKVVVSGGTASGSQAIALKLGTTATGYYLGLTSTVYASSGFYGTGTTNNGANFGICGWADADHIGINFDIVNPYLAKRTLINAWVSGSSVGGVAAGLLNNTTSYTGFSLIVSGTLTGGTIRVYGYRK